MLSVKDVPKFNVDSDPNMLDLIFQQQLLNTKLLLINFGDISASIFKISFIFKNNLNEIYITTTIRICSGINYNLSNLPFFPI